MTQETWDESYRTNATPWRDLLPDLSAWLEQAGVRSGAALDLGCGTGEHAAWLADHGFEVEALDFSSEALRIARQQFTKPHFTQWDLNELGTYPFRHVVYDIILDNKVLPFVDNKDAYLRTIQNKLKGVFIMNIFLRHDEKPNIAVAQDVLKALTEKYFQTIQKKVFEKPGVISALYWLKSNKK